ncbi:AcrR family transcriptional regulator [Amycolatopsis bartoniae]|uniref:TetR family transcriptional regulator n=1 Tax=Amycolatopsis bartoniae TaxID=941986 RepID=A0A8H9IRM3_9PSEU|nr:TetR/AcrR family transcriptional regulator [Amycolatopsis bartoniae]MBB2937903.1 AcrR family transcriptional regulator [Amycolatopsis bartoniae]TVT08601.1 TetR/AcrR family transcriptional regulator [Amycolatopsis bartoniae]GHF41582.1 TetR family transcriptional regulator [Amycolatopsis bartoniae]
MPRTREDGSRRRGTPSKGDLRERAILDAAEQQLAGGPEGITVETLAKAAGISRGAFYFYFGSRNDVLAALVERTVTTLRAEVDAADAAAAPADALREGVRHTARMWREHGPVMRVAVELSPTVPAVDEAWRSAVDALAATTRRIAERAGVPAGTGPTDAGALTTALVWMTERTFYQATVTGTSLDEATTTLVHVWLTALGLRE